MSASQRLRSAGAATFFVHVVALLLSAPAALHLALRLDSMTAGQPDGAMSLDRPGGGVLLEVLGNLGAHAGWLSLTAGLCALATLVVTPWLAATWLSALSGTGSLPAAAKDGARLYGRSLGLSAIYVAGLALCLGVSSLGALLYFPLGLVDDPRPMTFALPFAVLAPAATSVLLMGTVHDLSRAAMVRDRLGVGPALSAGIRGLRPRFVAAYAGWLAVGGALAALGHALGRALDGPGFGHVVAALLVGQTIALARTFVRGRWLAAAVEIAPATPPPAPQDDPAAPVTPGS